MSWKFEVLPKGSIQWYTNIMRCATREGAEAYVKGLMGAADDTRITESDDPVNYLSVWQQ